MSVWISECEAHMYLDRSRKLALGNIKVIGLTIDKVLTMFVNGASLFVYSIKRILLKMFKLSNGVRKL